MAQPVVPPPGFEDLSTEEKIAYVQALWDLIAENPSDVPIPDWQRAVIAERLAEARSPDAAVKLWSEVRAELRTKLRVARD